MYGEVHGGLEYRQQAIRITDPARISRRGYDRWVRLDLKAWTGGAKRPEERVVHVKTAAAEIPTSLPLVQTDIFALR